MAAFSYATINAQVVITGDEDDSIRIGRIAPNTDPVTWGMSNATLDSGPGNDRILIEDVEDGLWSLPAYDPDKPTEKAMEEF